MNTEQAYCVFSTDWGYFGFCAEAGRLKRTCLPCGEASIVEQALLAGRPGAYEAGLMRSVQTRIQAYFQGEPVTFQDVRLCHTGQSPFYQNVYRALRKIPPGVTVSYAELAHMAGHASAARAVGRAMSVNPTPLIVPCHRVVRASGGLGGFSAQGGVEVKKRLLGHEKVIPV